MPSGLIILPCMRTWEVKVESSTNLKAGFLPSARSWPALTTTSAATARVSRKSEGPMCAEDMVPERRVHEIVAVVEAVMRSERPMEQHSGLSGVMRVMSTGTWAGGYVICPMHHMPHFSSPMPDRPTPVVKNRSCGKWVVRLHVHSDAQALHTPHLGPWAGRAQGAASRGLGPAARAAPGVERVCQWKHRVHMQLSQPACHGMAG